MDTGWIQVFVLTLAECVAPSGKSVCQESQFELTFLNRTDCEFALEQLVQLKSASDQVIVDEARSSCAATTAQSEIFPSVEAATATLSEQPDWRAPELDEASQPSAARISHQERLESLKPCEETRDVAPCKVGDIIVEGMAQPVDVWRQD